MTGKLSLDKNHLTIDDGLSKRTIAVIALTDLIVAEEIVKRWNQLPIAEIMLEDVRKRADVLACERRAFREFQAKIVDAVAGIGSI